MSGFFIYLNEEGIYIYYKVARIVNTHGIHGDVKVISETDFPEQRFSVGQKLTIVMSDQTHLEVTIQKSRPHKGTYIISFEEFNNINEVERFKNNWLAIHKDQQHELDDFEFYHHEIIGLNVKTSNDDNYGIVKEILAYGPNDVWIIQRNELGKKDVLVPYIKEVVKDVNLEHGYITIDLMEGLVDDEN